MAKTHITRTFGPIHFEDLDPHRFEDLVREIIYDYKDWQSIEATGRGGADDGFDIRAFEKNLVNSYREEDSESLDGLQVSSEGNLWMIQCKRELEVGPSKVGKILTESLSKTEPPYGYILVTSANLSKKSYDSFRTEARKFGIMEFYIWGKAELEDFLHMPKNDRILFTFFGISLISKTRSKTTEVRAKVLAKNKLLNIFKQNFDINKRILIKDINAKEYPNENNNNELENLPKWLSATAVQFGVNDLWVKYREHYGFINRDKKEWDCIADFDLHYEPNDVFEVDKIMQKMNLDTAVKNFWEVQQSSNKCQVVFWGAIPFEEILIIDDKGDIMHQYPHLYLDFKNKNPPFF